jgi:hypothetical protein
MADTFWSYVGVLWERMDANKGEGQAARVFVHLHDESFAPANVQSHPPYLIFQTVDDDRNVRVVIVREELIEKVDVRFVKADKQGTGFQVAKPDEELPL